MLLAANPAMYTRQRASHDGPTRFHGKYAGIVISNETQGSSDHLGHIKIKVPSILEEDEGNGGTKAIEVVARPSFPAGFFFVPEEGANVWVEFMAGMLEEPIWTGVWYPAEPEEEPAAAPVDADGEAPTQTRKIIRTARGNTVQIDDEEGAERIVVRIQNPDSEDELCEIRLDQDGVHIEATSERIVDIRDGSQNFISLSADGIELSARDAASTVVMSDSAITLTVGSASIEIVDGAITLKADKVDVE
jgi:uncharacterized protein involved in type VI secretion and phage assembly